MIFTFAALCAGCAGLPLEKRGDTAGKGLLTYQNKAMEYEKEGELQLALANWRIAETLMSKKISALTDHMENKAEKHYQKGLSQRKNGHWNEAVKEFLSALQNDRNHKQALRHLKKGAVLSRNIRYKVEEGDTYESIASQVYKNPAYEFIVRSFAGVDKKGLVSGTVIELPHLELEFTRRFFNFNKEILVARKIFKEKDFQKLLPVAENILVHVPDNEEAVYLINSSYYGLAEKYFSEENYPGAIDMLKMIDPRFRNVKNRILYIERVQAMRINEAKDSTNRANYTKGYELVRKKQYVQALAYYEKADPGYKDVKEKISGLKITMKNQSEKHYMKGVEYFLNEKLEEAIGQWKETLALDPSNTKAKKDIENAAQLLKKIKKIK